MRLLPGAFGISSASLDMYLRSDLVTKWISSLPSMREYDIVLDLKNEIIISNVIWQHHWRQDHEWEDKSPGVNDLRAP